MYRPHHEKRSEEPSQNPHTDYDTTYAESYSGIFPPSEVYPFPIEVDGAIAIFNYLAQRILDVRSERAAHLQAVRDLNRAAEASMYRVQELTDTLNLCAAETKNKLVQISRLEEEFEQHREETRKLKDELEAQKAQLHMMTKKYLDSNDGLESADFNIYKKKLMLRDKAILIKKDMETLQHVNERLRDLEILQNDNERLRSENPADKKAPALAKERPRWEICGQELTLKAGSFDEDKDDLITLSDPDVDDPRSPDGDMDDSRCFDGDMDDSRCFGGDADDPITSNFYRKGGESPKSGDDDWVSIEETAPTYGQPRTAESQRTADLCTGIGKYLAMRCVRLSMLPPEMNTRMLSRIVRGGRIEYMHVHSSAVHGTCKATIFFLSEASAKAFHEWATSPPALTVNGSKIQSELVTVTAAPPALAQNCETRVLVMRVPSGTSIKAAIQEIESISTRHQMHIRLQSAQTWVDNGLTFARYVFEGSAMASLVLKAVHLNGVDPEDPDEAGYSYDECEDELWGPDDKAWNFPP